MNIETTHTCCKCSKNLEPTHWSKSNSCPDGFVTHHCTNPECEAFNIRLLERDFHERTGEYINMGLEDRAAWADGVALTPAYRLLNESSKRVLLSRNIAHGDVNS